MGAIVFALEAFLDTYRLAALLIGVFAVEYLARKQGFQWDETGKRTTMQSARMVAAGFGLGAAVVLLMVGVAWGAGLAKVTMGSPTLVGLGLGVVTPLAQAARDELLFRGAPLAMMKDRIPDRFALPFVALLGAAPLWLQPNPSLVGIAIAVVTGWVFALALRAGRGVLLAWGAHAGWLFMLGAGTRGGVLDVSLGAGIWLPLGYAEGTVAWVAFGVVTLVAVGASVLYFRRRPSTAPSTAPSTGPAPSEAQ
jgi:hypothetical protein